jgi:two-component system response regulator HydG
MSVSVTQQETSFSCESPGHDAQVDCLTIAYSADEPWRVGETAPILAKAHAVMLGRGQAAAGTAARVVFGQLRAGLFTPMAPLENPKVSREQLRITMRGASLHVENVGRCTLVVDGEQVKEALLCPGQILEIGRQLILLVERRHWGASDARRKLVDGADFAFGLSDRDGLVGESDEIWALRAQLASLAERTEHVLVTGASGTGKELLARALHRRAAPRGTFVARSAATIPESLIDAELFGNIKNYPNPTTPARSGLIGEADQGTLFLDEIGELPIPMQARLLRVLDDGEYHPLGEALPRRVQLRFVGATNRGEGELKPDLEARFKLRMRAPALSERRSDIPLLLRALALKASGGEPRGAFVHGPDGRAGLVVGHGFLRALLVHPLRTNVRELERLVLYALTASNGGPLDASAELARVRPLHVDESPAETPTATTAPESLTAEQLQEALDAHGGVLENTWRALGLANRFVLRRLIQKHGLKLRRDG